MRFLFFLLRNDLVDTLREIGKQHAVQMIDFMLKGSGQKLRPFDFEFIAVAILTAHLHVKGAPYIAVMLGMLRQPSGRTALRRVRRFAD